MHDYSGLKSSDLELEDLQQELMKYDRYVRLYHDVSKYFLVVLHNDASSSMRLEECSLE